MPNIQNFATGGDLPAGLMSQQRGPRQVNFGGQAQPIAQQQMTQSQLLGQLLSGGQSVAGLEGGQNQGLQQLQAAILKKGAQDAMTRNSPAAQRQVGNQIGSNILQNQVIPSGF